MEKKRRKWKEQEKQSTMSRAREAQQQLAANYYGVDGFPESIFVFIIIELVGKKKPSENERCYIILLQGKSG